MNGPLEGIRVLDFTWALAGPFGTMQLADLGAERSLLHQGVVSGALMALPGRRSAVGRHADLLAHIEDRTGRAAWEAGRANMFAEGDEQAVDVHPVPRR